jgi:hypothetical protein
MVIGKKIIIRRFIKGAAIKHALHKRRGDSREDSACNGTVEEVRVRLWQGTMYKQKKHRVGWQQNAIAGRGINSKEKSEGSK